jgi:membrane-bound ClpP family serine protease
LEKLILFSYSLAQMIAAIVSITFVLSLLIFVILRSRHKRHPAVDSLINSIAIADTPLTPVGTILIHGELWLATTANGTSIPAKARVTIVGTKDHLLLVS